MNTQRVILIVLFCFQITMVYSQNWQVDWEKQLGNRKMDYFTDVIEDKNGGFTVLGSIYPEGGSSCDYWLVRYNETGDTIWTRSFGSDSLEIPKRLVQNADGSYLLLGSVKEENSDNLFFVKADSQGNELWRKSFKSDINYFGEDVVSLEEEGFILVGAKSTEQENKKLWMTKLDAKGEMVWEKTFGEEFTGCCKSIKKLPTGGFAITGEISTPGQKESDIWGARTDENGELVWESQISTPGLKAWPECICCSPDSCFMMVGWQGACMNDINSEEPIFNFDLVLVKLDCNGKVLWIKNFDREGSEGGNAVTIRPDGNFIVAGVKAASFLGKIGPWLMLVDSEGKLLSENLIKSHFRNDQATKVINCSDGGFVVIGPGIQDESNYRSNSWIIKFASL